MSPHSIATFGRYADRTLARDVALTVPESAPVAGCLTAVKVFETRAVFVVEVSLGTFQRIQDEQLFELSPETTAPDQLCGFVSTSPLDLELTLIPRLAAAQRAAQPDPETLLTRLITGLEGRDAALPLTHAASFRWLRVMQRTTAPAGTTRKVGLHSVFARGDAP